MEDDGIKSSVGYLQVLSGKLKISFPAGVQQLYPLHITSLKFCGKNRRKTILEQNVTAAYLPTKVEKQNSGNENPTVLHT